MTVLITAVLVGLAAVAVALVLRRRAVRPLEPAGNWHVPTTLQRADFVRPEAPWLVVAFTSATCQTCTATWERARPLESREVAVQQVEATAHRKLHERYRIDAVPLVVVADAAGGVQAHFLGPVTATDLWGALAELRSPGTVPPGCSPSS